MNGRDLNSLTPLTCYYVQAVFFVLDQMELFTKSKQNLLYSLLNLMQEKEPPVAIIGMAGVLVRSPSLLGPFDVCAVRR
jgi:Cdc6-like AAA superfamily ATPase